MIPFPTIPEVETGMALGATVLNSYHSGVRYLLGQSHEPIAPQMTQYYKTFGTSMTLGFSWFLPYRGDHISYHYILSCRVDAAAEGDMELYYIGDDLSNHTAFSDHVDSGDGYTKSVTGELIAGTDYGTSMTPGNVYQWCMCLKTNSPHYSECMFWELTSHYNAVTGWVVPHAFVANAVSAAADLNKFRTDLASMNTYRLSGAKGLMTCPNKFFTVGSASMLECASFVMRYRPDYLRANVWCQSVVGAPYHWKWAVKSTIWGGATIDLYTEPDWIVQPDDNGLWGTEANIDMTGLGYSLGDWIRISFWVQGTTVVNLQAIRYLCHRYSTGTPEAGYEALTDWAEGDSDIGDTNLNKISTDLLHFYDGGPEELWGYTAAVANSALLTQHRHTGPHLKRWLHYKITTGQTPAFTFGPNDTRTATLTSGTGWLVADLNSTEIAPGSTYELTGCDGCFESNSSAL